MRLSVRSLVVFAVTAFLLSGADYVQAEDILAVPKLQGKAKRTAGKFAKALRAEIRGEDYKVLGPVSMKKAGRRVGAKARSLEAAREAEASLLLLGKIRGKKKKTISISLIDVSDGRTLETVTRKFRKSRRAKSLGTAVARELLPSIRAFFEKAKKPKPGRAIVARAGSKSSAVVPKDETQETSEDDEFPDPVVAAPKREAPKSSVPKDEWSETPAVAKKVPAVSEPTNFTKNDESSGDEKSSSMGLSVDLEAGGMNHRYTVTVGDVATGLAYGLDFVPSFGGRLGWTSPWAGLSLALTGNYQPFQFDVAAVDPPLNPVTPTGGFLSLGGELSMSLKINSSLRFEPVLGAKQVTMTVQEQVTVDGTPSSVVLSWASLQPFVGVKTVFSLMDNYLDVELDTRYLQVLSYDETPNVSGADASGFGFDAGLNFRYWLNHWAGLYLRTNYTYMKVGFSGEGDRLLFDADRVTLAIDRLLDASAYHSWLTSHVGVRLSF